MSLLDTAKATPVKAARKVVSTPEQIELAVAWVKGEIGTAQAAVALGSKDAGNADSALKIFLKHAVATGAV